MSQTIIQPVEASTQAIELKSIKIQGEEFFKITNSDELRPFFMSIISHSNHWLFISSNGGLSAGRKNSNFALFPYYTDDKITESVEVTGSKSIFWIQQNGKKHLWEPFSIRGKGKYNISRNLYKSVAGNKVRFEEVNHDLNCRFCYEWNSSNEFGFVKKSYFFNDSSQTFQLELLDGLQNIIPHGVPAEVQNKTSNLVDAYKRSELLQPSGLGIFALSAIIVDKAEPSEALKANIAWSSGLPKPKYLLSSLQLDVFRNGQNIKEETDIKGEKGAYFVHANIPIAANGKQEWITVANVNQTQSNVVAFAKQIENNPDLQTKVLASIQEGTEKLVQLNANSDALQKTSDSLRDTRHFSNTLFNIMRGGIFDNNYQVEKWDFIKYIKNANLQLFKEVEELVTALSEEFSIFQLQEEAQNSNIPDFIRLSMEYMTLKFSRRHGDPSRPWNRFSINTNSEVDGSKILDYEGNWRDIFQNWEALAHSYPAFIDSMIAKFLNTSTFDGYNPYRVTKSGFDWETIEPDDPWSYIGYWGDHQIIYLLKFLEFIENYNPGQLQTYFHQEIFVYANVPYKIKPYEEILKNPKDTIVFDLEEDERIRKERKKIGADGALLRDENDQVIRVNLIEKILTTVLAKMSNFIPEGGIWMNTQRPEWNDANNALVGNGVSMVTLYYLRRFLNHFGTIIQNTKEEQVKVSNELVDCYKQIRQTLEDNLQLLDSSINNKDRKAILDQLGNAASEFREHVYEQKFWGKKRSISYKGLQRFVELSLAFLDHSIEANKRKDGLYHAYNLMTVENQQEISLGYLDEMLEGQVAVLSSGKLNATQALEVLDGLKQSQLFREDQYSYILYPNKDLPGFLEKNNIPKSSVEQSDLLNRLISNGQNQILEQDVAGNYHFNGNFRNAADLKSALESGAKNNLFDATEEEINNVLAVFEEVFNHKAFTGRSGTFFGYEGLGSIYWHMVSKLLLATQECCLQAIQNQESPEIIGKLLEHFYEINEGIGVHKSPELYGAFPTDPYSHTPAGKGAQQPGMTGQVKEDILARFGELGVVANKGKLHFHPNLLRKSEFLQEESIYNCIGLNGEKQAIQLPANSLAFSFCQVPIVYELANKNQITIHLRNQEEIQLDGLAMDKEISQKLFNRTGELNSIFVKIQQNILK